MMMFVNYNGHFFPAENTLFSAQNRSYKYGDGCFETMKVVNGEIQLAHLHFERLFLALQFLKMQLPAEWNGESLSKQILLLCRKNQLMRLARVRLSVFRSETLGAEFVIEALPLAAEVNSWNDKGWRLDLFADARKSCDAYANLKSANFLPYVLAEIAAREKQLDDCILLNTENNICDTSRANIFLIRQNIISTPALHQGCVSGVMRRHMIDNLKKAGYAVHQKAITAEDLLQADEIFVTNAIIGLRWVGQYKQKIFGCLQCQKIYPLISAPAIIS